MALELRVCRNRRLIPCPLLRWDPLKDQATVLEEGQRVEVCLSENLPFSKTACRQITSKPQMLSLQQAKALLHTAGELRLEPQWVTQVTNAYHEMLQAIADHHRLHVPKLLLAPLISPPVSKKPKSSFSTSGKQPTRPITTIPSPHMTPYQARIMEEAKQRQVRHAREEKIYAEFRARELRQQQLEDLRLKQRRQKQAKKRELTTQQLQEQQRRQEESVREQVDKRKELQLAYWQAARQARSLDLRVPVLYTKIQLTTITVPSQFKPLGPSSFINWLPARLELELNSKVGTIFVPLVLLLGSNPKLCKCIRTAQQGMTDEECFVLLKSCLESNSFQTTPFVLDLLESLYRQISKRARDQTLLKSHLPEFTRQLDWRRRRCAETYGYRSQELAAQTAKRSASLLEKGERVKNGKVKSTGVHRASEWGSEWDSGGRGITNFNPFEYK